MTLATRTVTLPGGLQAPVHQPQADRGCRRGSPPAATTNRRASAGAPAGTSAVLRRRALRDDDRLMGWVQRRGGSVNATTGSP